MEKKREMCQSCGMPLTQDPSHGGTNADGTKNMQYCSYCYQNGDFLFKGDVKTFQAHCKEIMIKKGMPKWKAWLFTRGMHRLERWKS